MVAASLEQGIRAASTGLTGCTAAIPLVGGDWGRPRLFSIVAPDLCWNIGPTFPEIATTRKTGPRQLRSLGLVGDRHRIHAPALAARGGAPSLSFHGGSSRPCIARLRIKLLLGPQHEAGSHKRGGYQHRPSRQCIALEPGLDKRRAYIDAVHGDNHEQQVCQSPDDKPATPDQKPRSNYRDRPERSDNSARPVNKERVFGRWDDLVVFLLALARLGERRQKGQWASGRQLGLEPVLFTSR